MRLSEKSIFREISTHSINTVQRSIAFYFRSLVEIFRFYHFSDSLINDKTPVDIKSKESLENSKSYSIDDIRNTHPNAYNSWTPEEENMLISEYRTGKTIEELMVILGRQKGGITSMLRKLGIKL